jgi:hypothetical protein
MTDRKTKTAGPLSIFHKLDAGNVPAPWVPPEVPAAGKVDAGKIPAPWMPPELPAVGKLDAGNVPAPWVPPDSAALSAAPAAAVTTEIAKLKPWVPPAEAPRKLPAVVEDVDETPEPKKRKKKRGKKQVPAALPTQNTGAAAGPTIINIVNKVEAPAPAPVYVSPWWGWWGGGCPNFSCPRHAGRMCFRVWCWHW